MQIIEVTNSTLAKEFIEMAPKLYKDDVNYIRPWDHDIEDVFSKEKNKYFRQGDAIRWILQSEGKTIGRIAAFVHPNYERKKEATGACGFFECINNQAAANLLFDTAKQWLETQGKTIMEGPINFGEKDKWWGLLVEGFDPPLYGMNYNPTYYKDLFENYGFKDYYQQFVFRYDLSQPAPERFHRIYKGLIKDPNYRFEHATKKNLDKYAEDFRTVYNEAWAKAHAGFKPMRSEQTKQIMRQLKPIMVEETLIFAYYKEQPIGIFLSIPNLNQVIRYLNGKFGLWEKIKFIYHLKIKKSYDTLSAIIFGVVPEFQGKGVDAGLAVTGQFLMIDPGKYNYLEMMWIGDFNPKMIKIAKELNTTKSRTYITYRYLFDRSAEFKRHPVINVKK